MGGGDRPILLASHHAPRRAGSKTWWSPQWVRSGENDIQICAPELPVCEFSVLDSDRIVARSAAWFGLYDSSICSTLEKSTSAVTCARTLARPTIGSRMSSIRLIVEASIWDR